MSNNKDTNTKRNISDDNVHYQTQQTQKEAEGKPSVQEKETETCDNEIGNQENRMLSGQLFHPGDPSLIMKRLKAKYLCHQLNKQLSELDVFHSTTAIPVTANLNIHSDVAKNSSNKGSDVHEKKNNANNRRNDMLNEPSHPSSMNQDLNTIFSELLHERDQLARQLFGEIGLNCNIGPSFDCDYGCNIYLGDRVFMNSGCIILDCAKVIIGNDVFLGPNVQIYTVGHPLDADTRRKGLEFAKPITIEKDVWIGGGVIILPGISIGEGAIVGAGSVVTKNVDPFTVVAGNPAKLIKRTV